VANCSFPALPSELIKSELWSERALTLSEIGPGMSPNTKPADPFGTLCDEMHAFLSKFGVIDALGNGDLDICLDNYNDRDFYVLVNNISAIYPSWISGIQTILREVGGNWRVHIRLGIPAEGDRAKVDSPGIEISSREATELWDRDYLVRTFGSAFHFAR
jgi:hypothetical protein